MADADRYLRRIQKASERVHRVEESLDEARDALQAEMRAALEAGVSKSAMARALGVTRQRVQVMLRE
jgi:hypothetical protein